MADPLADPRSSDTGLKAGLRYPSPFFDIASLFIPPRLKDLLKFCQLYAFSDEIISATVYKLAQFPITDFIYDTKDGDLRERWTRILEVDLSIRTRLEEAGLDYYCLHGDAKVVAENGIFKIKDLAGKTARVLSQDGVYRPASFKSYGKQELLEVELSDGRTILATPEHQWPTVTCSGNVIKRTTEDLVGATLLRNVAPRPEQNDDFREGVCHGFVFGDGTVYNKTRPRQFSGAVFYHSAPKDLGVLKYFEGRGSHSENAEGDIFVHGLPAHYKQLPENEKSASYWYGFVCGFLAADGSVDVAGCAVLTQRSEATLRAIEEQLPRIGMVAGIVREHFTESGYAPGPCCYLSLYKQFMVPGDFLLEHHRRRFEENFRPTNYGRHLRVVDVRETGIVDEVFCCVEDETHTFTVDNGVLTGNCYGNYIASFYTPFIRFLVCPHCKKQSPIRSTKFHFKINDFRFYSRCQSCSPDELIPFNVLDKPMTRTTQGMNIVRWDPANIDIEFNPISGNSTYYYNIPNQFKRQIWAGRRKVLEETPISFIMAAKEGARVELDAANLIHIRRPSFSYFDNGWGMPLIVPLLKSKFYFQLLLKAREALLQQHILPLWMLYPLPQANLDPHGHLAMAKWRQEIENAVKKWRRDPNYIATFPIPTGFQQIGGDARALSVIDEMRFLQETMIVGLQVPREFLLGGASWSGSSVTFRMLENFFMNHVRGLKTLVRFVIEKVSVATKLRKVDVSMTRLRWVDDIQQKSLLMQANVQGKVSDDTFISEVGHVMAKEYEKMQEEVEKRSKITIAQAKKQAEAEGEAMLVQMQYQQKAQMEMAKAQKNLMAEYQAMGYSPEQINAMMMQTQTQQPQGGQFTPKGILGKEPNKPGVSQGGQPALNPDMWAGQFASTLMQAGEAEREKMLMDLQLRDQNLHSLVQQKLMQLQGIDQRPNPEQRPPTRNPGKTPSPSRV